MRHTGKRKGETQLLFDMNSSELSSVVPALREAAELPTAQPQRGFVLWIQGTHELLQLIHLLCWTFGTKVCHCCYVCPLVAAGTQKCPKYL